MAREIEFQIPIYGSETSFVWLIYSVAYYV
jgi:hypothetical protein